MHVIPIFPPGTTSGQITQPTVRVRWRTREVFA